MVDIHVYVVPIEFWRDSLNSVSSDAVIEALSSGFLHVDPEISLAEIRHYIYEQLQSDIIPSEFCFLRIVGRCLAKVSDKQELLLRAKSFLPPFTFSPDIYLIDSRVTKRPLPRSTGSNNSDNLSLPRLTPNYSNNNLGAFDQEPGNFPSPPLVIDNNYGKTVNGGLSQKLSNINNLEIEPQKSIGRTSYRDYPQKMGANEYPDDAGISDDVQPQRKSYADADIVKKSQLQDGSQNMAQILNPELSRPEHGSNVMAVKLELAKRERTEIEVRRKNLLKRLHELQETVQHKRKEAYEYWRARFLDEKGRTPYLEDQASALGKDIDNLHKKLVRQLGNNNTGDASLLNRQLQVLKLRQTVDLLKLKVEEGNTKLMCQIRLRNQAETELRAMRAELTQKKVLVQLLKSKLPVGAEL